MNDVAGICISRLTEEIAAFVNSSRYSVVYLREGFTKAEVDFRDVPAEPHSVFFLAPGRTIRLEADRLAGGWAISFTHEQFQEVSGSNLTIRNVDVLASFGDIPRIILSPKIGDRICSLAEMIDELAGAPIPHRDAAIASLLRTILIYCDSRCNITLSEESNRTHVQIVSEFKCLVARHLATHHRVSDYAAMMHISSKYLNQIVKDVLGVTAKSIIQEQLTLQARRELKFSNDSVKEIAFRLGFTEPFYFSNYFKKQMGCSPTEYRAL